MHIFTLAKWSSRNSTLAVLQVHACVLCLEDKGKSKVSFFFSRLQYIVRVPLYKGFSTTNSLFPIDQFLFLSEILICTTFPLLHMAIECHVMYKHLILYKWCRMQLHVVTSKFKCWILKLEVKFGRVLRHMLTSQKILEIKFCLKYKILCFLKIGALLLLLLLLKWNSAN